MQKLQGWVERGNTLVTVAGLASTTKIQGSFPLATVTVYTHLPVAVSFTAIVRSGNVVTVTLPAGFGFVVGNNVTISGVADNSFNGTFVILSVGATTFTYAQAGADDTDTTGTASSIQKASIYSDDNSSPTPLANPFTASSTGTWGFYTVNGRYDVKFSGTGVGASFTLSDFFLFDESRLVIDASSSPYNVSPDASGGHNCLGINNALYAAAALGGAIVYIPPGNYTVIGELVKPAGASVSIRGAGAKITTLTRSGTSTLFSVSDSHLRAEWFTQISSIGLDGDSTDGTLLDIAGTTNLILRDLYIRGSNHTGINLISLRDSHIENVFVESCGDSTHPCALFDTVAVVGEGFNANRFYNFHVETNNDTILLDMIGNVTAIVDANSFYSCKLHGDPLTTNNPNRPLLRLGANASLNSFFGGLVAFGRGTSQIEDSGNNNLFIGTVLGLGPIAQPECGFDMKGGRLHVDSAEFSSGNYAVVGGHAGSGVLFRNSGNFNVVDDPKYGSGTLFADIAGSMSIQYDKPDNTGKYFYCTRGFVFSVATDFQVNTTGKIASGTYTPTLFNTANISASVSNGAQWMRVGSTVTVSGSVNVDPTAAGSTILGISLPIASDLGSLANCQGVAASPGVAGQSAAIEGDTVNDRAVMQWIAVDTTNQRMAFTFTYQVV